MKEIAKYEIDCNNENKFLCSDFDGEHNFVGDILKKILQKHNLGLEHMMFESDVIAMLSEKGINVVIVGGW